MSDIEKMLNAAMNGEVIDEIEEVIDDPIKKEDKADNAGDLAIPAYESKKKEKPDREESARVLREARDQARQELEQAKKEVEELKSKSSIYDVAKQLIGKDEVTAEDLKKMFEDYDFTKKEKESLAENLKKSQERIREFDITSSQEYQEKYITPLQEAAEALSAEIMPIHAGKPVEVPVAVRGVFDEIISSGQLDNVAIKAAIYKIKDAYEEDGIDFAIPSIMNVKSYLRTIIDAEKSKQEIFESWETAKKEKELERQAMGSVKDELTTAKTRQERIALTKSLMSKIMNDEAYEYIEELHGHENVMNTIISQHNALSEAMENPSKAPAYDDLVNAYAKAALYDRMIEERAKSGKIAGIKKAKAAIESAGVKPSTSNKEMSDTAKLLAAQGVY